MKSVTYISSLGLLIFFLGCTIRTPEVTFTSERTALEKQILGYYRTIEEDVMLVPAAAADTMAQVQIKAGKSEIVEAFANRKFNADDIEDFAHDGTVGENTDGLLTVFPTEQYQQDSTYQTRVDRVVKEENHDRNVIMSRLLELQTLAEPMDTTSIRQVFAKMNRDAAVKGTLIENSDGSWSRK